MKKLGVGFLQRQMGKMATPVIGLSEKDGEYTFSMESKFKNTYTKFRMNQEFDETTPDGRAVRTVFTQDKNKLIQVQVGGGQTTRVTREFTPERVMVTVEVDDLTSVRVYKAAELNA